MKFKIDARERLYFSIKVVFTGGLLILASAAVVESSTGMEGIEYSAIFTVAAYLIIAIFLFGFQKMYLVGYMKGNGVAVTGGQFPEVYQIYRQMAADLGIKKIPKLFILESGGMLNAFAVRFSGHNYIAVYSDIFSLVRRDMAAVKFVLAHELGHVKRKHMSKGFWTFPSMIVPFLNSAYSRRCEYTCDNIGGAFVGEDSFKALMLLAAGRDLYSEINIGAYYDDAKENRSMVVRIVGLFMSHPFLPRRIENLGRIFTSGANDPR